MLTTDNEAFERRVQIDALNTDLLELRAFSKKQSIKIAKLRLWFYLTTVFTIALFSALLLQGFIHMPVYGAMPEPIIKVDTVYVEKVIEANEPESIRYNTHKAALPKEGYDGILFAIQIGAYKDLDLSKYKDNMLGLRQDICDSINQFTLGEFVEFEEAQNFLNIVRQMGFEQAHIMSFKNGYRIRLENALALRQQTHKTNHDTDNGTSESNNEHFDLLAH